MTTCEPQSSKQECFIQIGKRSHRIANDHHALLLTLSAEFRYLSMEELLFFTSLVGARLLAAFNPLAVINVYKRGDNQNG